MDENDIYGDGNRPINGQPEGVTLNKILGVVRGSSGVFGIGNVSVTGGGEITSPVTATSSGTSGIATTFSRTRLEDFLSRASNFNSQIAVLTTGDSIIHNMEPELWTALENIYGPAGYGIGTLTPTYSGGATGVTGAFTYWLNGKYDNVPSGGEVIYSVNGVSAAPGGTCAVYYIVEPGAGTFKIQSSLNGAAYVDVASFTSVDANGTLAGAVASFTLTGYGSYRLKVVGLTGSVKIISASIINSRSGTYTRYGIVRCSVALGGIDMSQTKLTPSAIVSPIMAHVAPQIVIESNVDGAAAVADDQDDVYDLINAGIVTPPAWIIIGPPCPQDIYVADYDAQAAAQIAWCDANYATWFDQRQAGGNTATEAIARGLLPASPDPHPTASGRALVVSALVLETGLLGNYLVGAARIRSLLLGNTRVETSGYDANDRILRMVGGLVLGVDPNNVGNGQGIFFLEDTAGPTSHTDRAAISFTSNNILITNQASGNVQLSIGPGSGQGVSLIDPASTASAPQGRLGTTTTPWREINIGKTITAAATTGAQVINKVSGSVNFAAAAGSLVVTNSFVSSTSLIFCTVGTNDATMKAAAAVAGAGSFEIFPDVAPTGETRVNFLVLN